MDNRNQKSTASQSRTMHDHLRGSSQAPHSHNNAPKLTKRKFKWWQGLILVGVVAVIGIVILRFSNAGTGSTLKKPTQPIIASKSTPLNKLFDFSEVQLQFYKNAYVSYNSTSKRFESKYYDLTDLNNLLFVEYKATSAANTFPVESAKVLQQQAAKNSGSTPSDLTTFYTIKLSKEVDTFALSQYLQKYMFIQSASPQSGAAQGRTTPDYTALQLYLQNVVTNYNTGLTVDNKPLVANTQGDNLTSAVAVPGALGDKVTVGVIDSGFDINHEDISKFRAPNSFIKTANPALGETELPFKGTEQHGTAVTGLLVADKNSFGVTGSVPNAKLLYGNGNYINSSGQTRSGIEVLLGKMGEKMQAGDVINISMGPSTMCGQAEVDLPIGYFPSENAVLQTLRQKGVIVVNAAGNNNNNYDDACYQGTWMNKPYGTDPTDPKIFLAGARSPGKWCTDLYGTEFLANLNARLPFSTYGRRVDMSAWGLCVMSTGKVAMTISGGVGPDYFNSYSFGFNGTSSASPMTAGVIASFVSAFKTKFGVVPPIDTIRQQILTTGVAQVTSAGSLAGNIGPMPSEEALFRSANLMPGQPNVNPFPVTPPPPPPPPVVPPPPPVTPPPPVVPPARPTPTSPPQKSPPIGSYTTSKTSVPPPTPSLIASAPVTSASIDAINFTYLSNSKIVLSWQTSLDSTSVVNYGKTTNYDNKIEEKTATKSHSAEFPVSSMNAGDTIHYQIVSTDQTGKTIQSADKTFTVPGYTVQVVVIDKNKQAVPNVPVKLGDSASTTNQEGIATFSNQTAGDKPVVVTTSKGQVTSSITVQKNANEAQKVSVTVAAEQQGNTASVVIVVIVLVLVVILGAAGYFFIKKRQEF